MTISNRKIFINKEVKLKVLIAVIYTLLSLTSFTINFLASHHSSLINDKQCTLNELKLLQKKYGDRYNYIIFNTGHKYHISWEGLRHKGMSYCKTRWYEYWVFRSGKFINKGDGGWTNWAFIGDFKRMGNDNKTVEFYRR